MHLVKAFSGIVVLILLPLITVQSAAPRPTGDVPVSVTIEGLGAETTPTLRIQSDQLGAYRHARNLQSIIQGIGDWELDMLLFTGSGRTVSIDLRDPVPNSAPNGTTPAAPFGYQLLPTRFIAKCTEYGNNFLTIPLGASRSCPLAVAFDFGGRRYRMAFNERNFPGEVDPVSVTCTAADSAGKCRAWRVEPGVLQSDGTRQSRAKLIRVAASKRETDQDLGEFYMSFAINVSNP